VKIIWLKFWLKVFCASLKYQVDGFHLNLHQAERMLRSNAVPAGLTALCVPLSLTAGAFPVIE